MCANFQAKTKSFGFFILNLPKNGFRVGNSENQCRNKNQYPRDTMRANFLAKRATLKFLAQICPKIDLGLKIKINVGIRISILEISCAPIFSQNKQIWIFCLNLGKLPNYTQYFDSNNVDGVAEELDGGGWSWMDVYEARWR